MEKPEKLLILDVNETLIHASQHELSYSSDFCFEHFYVYKRPYLNDFLIKVSEFYDIGLWSSGTVEYLDNIVKNIKPKNVDFAFIWDRKRCTYKKSKNGSFYVYEKHLYKLKKLGYSLEQMLIVDDIEENCLKNYGNAIYIEPFLGDKSDAELSLLTDYLIKIKDSTNFRTIEKRGWRSNTNL